MMTWIFEDENDDNNIWGWGLWREYLRMRMMTWILEDEDDVGMLILKRKGALFSTIPIIWKCNVMLNVTVSSFKKSNAPLHLAV